MKYINKFNNINEYNTFKQNREANKYYVSLVKGNIDVEYNKHTEFGIYIQHTDGTLYSVSEWQNLFANSSDLSNGVAIITKEVAFVISKQDASDTKKDWSSNNIMDTGGYLSDSIDGAKTDYDGRENTRYMMGYDKSQSGYCCSNYVFPNGKIGYLGSAGEWYIAYTYKNEIDAAMSVIGGNPISSDSPYWTSTQSERTDYRYSQMAFQIKWSTGDISIVSKSVERNVRAFTTIK